MQNIQNAIENVLRQNEQVADGEAAQGVAPNTNPKYKDVEAIL